jgi:gluconate 2-dehydrogenase subunit 3-like protein
MDAMERRVFLKGASMGLLAFTVGGSEILMTPGEARARAVPFRLLNAEEAETLEALGEALVPGARAAGVAHFIDQQVSVPPGEALLEARIVNIKPPFANFYRAAIAGIDKAITARNGKRFAAISASEQHDFIDALRQNKIEGWQGPPAGQVYFVLRSDAVDVVYGTMEGYESLGVPYLPHIAPDKRW